MVADVTTEGWPAGMGWVAAKFRSKRLDGVGPDLNSNGGKPRSSPEAASRVARESQEPGSCGCGRSGAIGVEELVLGTADVEERGKALGPGVVGIDVFGEDVLVTSIGTRDCVTLRGKE